MSISNLINNNKGILEEAINSGISCDTVNSTLNDLIEKKDRRGKTPRQLSKTVASIVYMKKRVDGIDTQEYYSNVVRNNSAKIKSALINGISSDEVAISLIDTINSPSKNAKKRLNFMVKLITKMKKKELKLQRQNTSMGYQKVYNNN